MYQGQGYECFLAKKVTIFFKCCISKMTIKIKYVILTGTSYGSYQHEELTSLEAVD